MHKFLYENRPIFSVFVGLMSGIAGSDGKAVFKHLRNWPSFFQSRSPCSVAASC